MKKEKGNTFLRDSSKYINKFLGPLQRPYDKRRKRRRKGNVMKVINNTPHVINIIDPKDTHFDAVIRKWVAATDDIKPILVIPSAGVLNAKISTVNADPVDGIPVFDKSIDGCDKLPDDGNIHVVSALFASAAAKSGMDMSRIMLVADPVMSADGKTFIGCRGLTKPF